MENIPPTMGYTKPSHNTPLDYFDNDENENHYKIRNESNGNTNNDSDSDSDSDSKNLSSKSDQSVGDGRSSNVGSDANNTIEEPPDADVNTGEQVLNVLQSCNADTARVLLTNENLRKAFNKNEKIKDILT